jgi:hypothetical protein
VRSILRVLLACLTLSACQSRALDAPQTAARFVEALNGGDVDLMAGLSATPFRFRNQEWKSAPDGSGLVRGAATERVANTVEELRALLQDVSGTVKVADHQPVADPPSKADLLSEPLSGAPAQWSDLNLVLFLRGEGDVEHIAIVGIDARGRVTGLYVN